MTSSPAKVRNPEPEAAGAGAAAAGPKVLRTCLMQGGKMVDEQRFRRREPLTIGTQPTNTFVVTDSTAPKAHELFAVRSGRYELVLTQGMRGKVSVAGSDTPVDVETLAAQGVLVQRGELLALPLSEAHRGKVTLGDTTVIFQFVSPSPTPEKPVLPVAARGTLWQRIDAVYAVSYLLVAALEIGFIIFLRYQPAPAPITLETMDDRFARLIVPDRKAADRKPPETKQAKAPVTKPKEVPKKEVAREAPEKDEATQRKAHAERRAGIRKNIANRGILAVLGTMGEGGAAGAVADVLSQGKLGGDLDSAFSGIAGVGVATAGSGRTTRGGGAGKEASIGGLQTGGGGRVAVGSKSEGRVAQVTGGEAEVDGSLDSGAVAKVVQSRMRMVQDCYERELKRDPNLAGKIEIEFTIGEDGRVETARVSSNKMGSDSVGQCIVGRIRSWRFPKPSGGSVTVNFPFIFAPSG